MSHEVCPICGEGHLFERTTKNAVTYKGQTAELDIHYSDCDICGVEQADAEQLKKNKRQMIAFRKKVDGLLSGADVAKLRNQLGITQIEASQIFGGGPTAFSKYESDDVAQSAAMDKLLRLAHDEHAFNQLKTIAGVGEVSRVVFRASWEALNVSPMELSRWAVMAVSSMDLSRKSPVKIIPGIESKDGRSWFNIEQKCA